MASQTEPKPGENFGGVVPAQPRNRHGSAHGWFAELKRRRVVRALVAYGIASFAVLQIIEPVMHGLHWPETVLSYVVVALAAGFPIVITLAWAFDVKAGRIERTAPAAAAGLKGIRLALLLVSIGVLAAAPGLFYYFVLRGHARGPNASGFGGNVATIAVLPFASSGSSGENAYFADGFHDELLRQMGRIGDLRVISRTSVMQYKDGARNLREIAEALGVSSVVEGSVQRAGNRVRVEARLIDARSDLQIWSDRYDRDLTDVFGIQTAVAEEIAGALHARLTPAQRAQIERKPTQNPEAYDLYLHALEYSRREGYEPRNTAIAEELYRKAIQKDPSFALARARLAQMRTRTFWFVKQTPRDVIEEAKTEAERSLQLQPDLPEGHLALGYYHYLGHLDYDRALKEFESARQGVPAEAIASIGYVKRRQGRYDEAIRSLREAARLDPRSASLLYELAGSLLVTRQYEEADRELDRALLIAPDFIPASAVKALVHEAWKGDTDLAKAVLHSTRGRLDPSGRLGEHFWVFGLAEHNPGEALPFLDSVVSESVNLYDAVYPKAFFYALAHEALGDTVQARRAYETALPLLEAEPSKNSGNARQLIVLARTYAGLGRKQDALREAKRAAELLPISKDAFDGAEVERGRALVEARVGETEAAIEHIRHLLSIPSELSPALLRLDPGWAPLRNDARFRKLAELE